jgi:aminopeptidase N
MRQLIPGIWILLLAAPSFADNYIRQPDVDIIHYEISVELRDTSDSISGTTRIHVRIRNESVSGMRFDFTGMQVDEVRVRGIKRNYGYGDGSLSFSFGRKYSRNEIAIVEVQYHGIPENGFLIRKNNHGRRVFFTENWPDYARYWFPSIDHPSDKATVQVTVTAPQQYDVVSNGRKIKTRLLSNGRKRTQWFEGKTIPTYCVAIGAAEFSVARQRNFGRTPIEWYSFPQDSKAASEKFRHTAAALQYFSSLIGHYPYEKLAQVQATTTFGGMENASAIFYTESSFQEVPVSEDPVSHEIAHQWFGDSVTPADWDHLWLSEGFAQYFEALFDQRMKGRELLKRTMAGYKDKLEAYRLARLLPVIDPAQTDPKKKLNALTYDKGAWVLHMLRGLIGDARFFKGIRHYYSLYEGKSVFSEDFQTVMESVSGISLDGFFKRWLYQPGWPEYRISWHWNEATREADILVRQTQATELFDMPLDIVFVEENRREARRLRIFSEEHSFHIPLQAKPSALDVDPDGWVLKTVSVEPF